MLVSQTLWIWRGRMFLFQKRGPNISDQSGPMMKRIDRGCGRAR